MQKLMRAAPFLAILSTLPCFAAVSLDRSFWENYRPYQQYSGETIRELIALEEGDLLETGRDIDGLELRIVGRSAPNSELISVRVVIDSVARQRLQVKTIPYSLSPNAAGRPTMQRRQVSVDQAQALLELLETSEFWIAPYRSTAVEDSGRSACRDAGHWIVEAVKPGSYQLIAREDCGDLDPLVRGLRDYLLGLADR